MSRSKLQWLALLTLGALVVDPACQNDVSTPQTPVNPAPTLAQLTSAPESVDLLHQSYRLETYLWRDFMPVAPPNGQPLSAVARLMSRDGQPIPDNVRMTHLWVINGTNVWTATFRAEPTRYDGVIEGFASGGPKWGPGIAVDVVVGVMVDSSGLRLVRARAQMINRTD